MDNSTTKKRYRYVIADGHIGDVIDQLNLLGNRGYHVVSHVIQPPADPHDPHYHTVIMVREIIVGPDGQELSS